MAGQRSTRDVDEAGDEDEDDDDDDAAAAAAAAADAGSSISGRCERLARNPGDVERLNAIKQMLLEHSTDSRGTHTHTHTHTARRSSAAHCTHD